MPFGNDTNPKWIQFTYDPATNRLLRSENGKPFMTRTLNEDGTANLAPMSSAWWLGWGCMLGMTSGSKTVENLRRTRQCVLNLPSAEQVAAVDRLALTTGSDPVPGYKVAMGFQVVPDKLGRARMSAAPSEIVSPPRIEDRVKPGATYRKKAPGCFFVNLEIGRVLYAER